MQQSDCLCCRDQACTKISNWTDKRELEMRKKSFIIGIGCGLLMGVGMVLGTLIGMSKASSGLATSFEVDGIVLQAATGDSSDKFCLATGKVSDSAEGVFLLDGLTGDLQCLVPYTRLGTFGGIFKTNVFNDLKVQRSKTPRFIMVTGEASFSGNNRPGNCIVYIVDASTGNYAAYGVPWNRQMETAGRPQQGQLLGMTSGQARNITIRE